jgi:RNA ligase (TIGR02306 family)
MSTWKVIKTKIVLSPHPNADLLQIGKVGTYQVVVQKGLYSNGDAVVFAPEKSVLSGAIRENFEKFLSGTDHNRVKTIRLRNEVSSGIIVPKHLIPNFDELPFETDISEQIGIIQYEPVIPEDMIGKLKITNIENVGSHDCEQISVYLDQLKPNERVVITEKLHGSQIIFAYDLEAEEYIVTSKKYRKDGLDIEEDYKNVYWQAVKNDSLVDMVKRNFTDGVIQVVGEVVPLWSGYKYGLTKPTLRIFDICKNGVSIPYDLVPDEFKSLWVPVLYDGELHLVEKEVDGIKYNLLADDILSFRKGKETLSGKSLHIREGVVLRPYVDRDASDGIKLRLKIINPDYRETGEEIS